MRSHSPSFKSALIVAALTALFTFAVAVQASAASPSAALNAFALNSYEPGASNLKTLVLMVRFADDPSDPAQLPVQLSQEKDVIFTQTASVHTFFLESSWNQLGLSGIVAPDGDVAGYYSTGINKPACSTSTIMQSTMAPVDTAAAAAGFDPANYDRIVYVLPTCNTAQSFSLEGTKRVWILGGSWSNAPVIAHELQHQFAVNGLTLGHANSISCVDAGTELPAALGTSCIRNGYSDFTDVMGQPNFPHISSTFVRMGVGELSRSYMTTAAAEGIYDLYSTAETPTAGHTYNLRIPLAAEPDIIMPAFGSVNFGGGRSSFLNLEYRQPHGIFDSDFSFTPNVTGGAMIRMAPEFGTGYYSNNEVLRTETQAVDTDQHTPNWFFPPTDPDYYVGPPVSGWDIDPLAVDTGFYDPTNDVLLRVVSNDATKIQVQYSHGLLTSEKTSVSVFDHKLRVTARAGYANDLDLRVDASNNVLVRDANAPVLATGGCTATAKNVASCPASAFEQIVIGSGDRRDYVEANVPGIPVSVLAGDGNDVIVGGPQNDTVDGGAGNDTILTKSGADIAIGGAGTDTVNTDTGDDVIVGVDGAADSVNCGDGADQLEPDAPDVVDTASCEPAGPIDTFITGGPVENGHSDSTTPSFSFVANRYDATFECSVDGGSVYNVCVSPYVAPAYVDGAHSFKVRAVPAAGATDATPASRSFTVINSQLLNKSLLTVPSGTHSLSTEGAIDWSHWGLATATSWDHKSGGSGISNVATVLSGTTIARVSTSVTPTVSWSGGTPTASSTGTATGITTGQAGAGRGFSFTVSGAQNSEAMTLKMYVGVIASSTTSIQQSGKLELYWSSTPGTIVTDAGTFSTNSTTTAANRIYQVTLRPPQANDTLNVRWTQNTSLARVRLYSATLNKVGVSRAAAPSSANLTTDGSPATSLDWAHWGGAVVPTTASLTPIAKSGATMISNATKQGTGTLSQATGTTNPVTTAYSWTNGDSTPSVSNVLTGISSTGGATGRGFSFTVPADAATMRTLKLYVGATNTSATAAQPVKLELFWGTSTIPFVTDVVPSMASSTANFLYTINLRHATAGTTLKVKWSTNTTSTSHRATLQSAVLLQN